jgi:hypothetical protein
MWRRLRVQAGWRGLKVHYNAVFAAENPKKCIIVQFLGVEKNGKKLLTQRR